LGVTVTVLGSTGFIGSHLVRYLRENEAEIYCPPRGDPSIFDRELGHVFYCIGLTADFRRRPFDTVRAHVCYLLEVLTRARFDSLLYLSSTRVYGGAKCGEEDACFQINPQDPSDLYNLSKLQGEALCHAANQKRVRIVRLSNVYGEDWNSDNFLTTLIRAAVDEKRIVLRTSLDSEKDYVSIKDVVPLLVRISLGGRRSLYNVASGFNLSTKKLVEGIQRATPCEVMVEPGAPRTSFPPLDTSLVRDEFGFAPVMLLDSLDHLVQQYRNWRSEEQKR
jgi:nucleoside-diphosphate-sugar epimerase